MKLTYKPYELELRYPFTIARFSRISTPLMLVKLEYESFTGLGEASMVPYMGENHQTAADFLQQIDTDNLKYPFNYDVIVSYLDSLSPGMPAIKAAVDIALHDLEGKILNKPCHELLNVNITDMPLTSVTIGIDAPEIIYKKIRDAENARIIKVKLGKDNDRELISTIRSVTDKALYVDVNQGWTDKQKALDMILWLKEQGVLLVEQPMAKTDIGGNSWITEHSPLPIIGDEAVQRFGDVEKAYGVYHGINVKLMKSAGMHEGLRMIKKARELKMNVLIGCMSETSIATMAAATLAPFCDWADLDGPFLTKNNPFADPLFADGKWVLTDSPGLGINKKN